MDFQEILAQASHNAQKSTKVISQSEKDRQERLKRDRELYAKRLEQERNQKKLKAPPPPPKPQPKQFVIPKKKPSDNGVTSDGISAYLEKQRADNLEKIKQQKKERDELIKKRLEVNGGRANKKIASQFGKSTIELQTKYAHNSHRELELFRREQKEQEAIEKQASKLKEGIDKAMEHRQKLQAKAGGSTKVTGARVGNVKADGFASLSSKHESVTTKRKSEEFKTMGSSQPKRKQPSFPSGGGSLDFQKLMEQAQQNKDIEKAAARAKAIREKRYDLLEQLDGKSSNPGPSSLKSSSSRDSIPSKVPRMEPKPSNGSLSSKEMFKKPTVSAKASLAAAKASSLKSTPSTSKSMSNSTSKLANQTKLSTAAMYAAEKKEPRILPGDIRYKGPSKSEKKEDERPKIDPYKAALSKYGGNGIVKNDKYDRLPAKSKINERDIEERRRAAAMLERDNKRSERDRYEKREKERYDRDRYDRGADRYRSRYDDKPLRRDYSEDEMDYEEEEYDSDLDGFIDDSELDDLERADFEESLRLINPRYNKKLWKARERMIDERRMQANFRDLEAEERRSSKLAMMEDIIEAERGSRGL
ncbi:unnamed protein product [Bursaphelenchus xylophilus]|uniref:(pine wood nematode) hypothetical protein n=1 Tax=Bursaphelenchus xylophilus TaxID=6326 RepID=A0A1I7RM09_BURXY|nr:unnamed protein product [Bursaphelenchus xylophilus]CAG9118090.1 unnamed protein product [Bursaphelenchus xylophilus]